MPLIQVHNLYKVFGPHPRAINEAMQRVEAGETKADILGHTGCTVGVNNASFSVESREIFVVMGLSGSGKSTALRCFNRLTEPTAGQVLVDDKNILDLGEKDLRQLRRRRMSMVFQHFGLLPHRSVVDNVAYGLEVQGVPRVERRNRAEDAIQRVGLEAYTDSRVQALSGGMQQRVGLARALAGSADILLMDEAFSALDPLIRTQMQDELLALQSELKKTIIFITHDLDEALKLGDRIAIMKDGEVVQIGTPEEILVSPADDYVRAFVRDVNRARVLTAESIMEPDIGVISERHSATEALRRMQENELTAILVVDDDQRLLGVLDLTMARQAANDERGGLRAVLAAHEQPTIHPSAPLRDLLEPAAQVTAPLAISDDDGRIQGAVTHSALLMAVSNSPDEEGNEEKDNMNRSDAADSDSSSPRTPGN